MGFHSGTKRLWQALKKHAVLFLDVIHSCSDFNLFMRKMDDAEQNAFFAKHLSDQQYCMAFMQCLMTSTAKQDVGLSTAGKLALLLSNIKDKQVYEAAFNACLPYLGQAVTLADLVDELGGSSKLCSDELRCRVLQKYSLAQLASMITSAKDLSMLYGLQRYPHAAAILIQACESKLPAFIETANDLCLMLSCADESMQLLNNARSQRIEVDDVLASLQGKPRRETCWQMWRKPQGENTTLGDGGVPAAHARKFSK